MSSFAWQIDLLRTLTVVSSLVLATGCENASSSTSAARTSSSFAEAKGMASGPIKTEEPDASQQTSEDSPGKPEPAADAKPADPPQAAGDVQLDVASWEETQAIIAEHKGKVVVIDLWSTFCVPCVKEFPNLVAIHEKYGDDVVCLSLNCNYSGVDTHEVEKAAVLEFLTAQKARFRNLMNREEDTDLYKKVGIASIPVVQVYGRDGKLAKQFDNEKDEYGKDGFTYADHIVPFVESLVKAKAE